MLPSTQHSKRIYHIKIVVTGAEGFLGRKVVERLAREDTSVIAVDRVAHEGEELQGVTYHQADLSDPVSLLPSAISHQPFVLVHLAWDMRRHLGHEVQNEMVKQFSAILEYWNDRGLSKLVAMGSAEEYGGYDGTIHEAVEPVLPLSPYGQAKRKAHDLAAAWSERENKAVLWLRPFVIYGPGQRGDMMIPYAVTCARDGKEADFTDGQQRRDFVYIDDVADAIALAVAAEPSGMNEVNIGTGRPVKVADVLMTIAKHFGAEENFHLGARPRRENEPDVQAADTTVAKELLGWKSQVDVFEGLKRTVSGRI